ncbi:EAL domain-containing protein [Christensenellaceae bacterium OttesenSCG-928-K19]|nr:EAL domain-containing protein [Christensenellaceae bacterium OttesenSCG-928-K19]
MGKENGRRDKLRSISKKEYLPVLSRFCDTVTELCLEDGSYKLVVLQGERDTSGAREGDYTTLIETIVKDYVDESDHAVFRDALSLDAVRKAAQQGSDVVTVQYRVRSNSGFKWVENRVFLHCDGWAVIVSHDIDYQKEYAGHNQRDVAQYGVALRNIYDELFEMNVTKNEFRLLHFREGKYVKPPQSGPLDALLERIVEEIIYVEDKAEFAAFIDPQKQREYFAEGSEARFLEFRELWVDLGYHWVSATLFPLARDGEEGDEVYLCFIMDIDEKKRAEEATEQNKQLQKQKMDDQRYRIIVNQTNTFVFEWYREGDARYVSKRLKNRFPAEYQARDVLDVLEKELVHEDDRRSFGDFVEELKQTRENSEVTVRLLDHSEEYKWCRIAMTYVNDEQKEPLRIIGTINDVDEAVQSKLALLHRAEYDTLTGILNMDAFYERAQELVQANPKKNYAVIRLDVNRFKLVNDLYGLDVGDNLLKHIARVLERCLAVREAVYGRLGGDVFVICVPYGRPEELVVLVRRIWQGVEEYDLRGNKASPSFGICYVEDRNIPMSIQCDWANLALKTVKGNMIKRWAFYGGKLREQQLDERMIESNMENALRSRQFVLYLQPKHDIRTGGIVGAEALIRWNHPTEGLMAPVRFVPLFERNGFIIKMDEFVWEQACVLLRKWIDKNKTPVPISMNVSRIHALNPGFEKRLLGMIARYRIPNELIELELTESTFVENQQELFQTMKTLQNAGLNVSMDDFGSGYSSLNMLKSVPVNTIKLDREFLNETTATSKGKIIMEHTISMVNDLGLKVVAEGVETQGQADFVDRAGCHIAQGYHYSKPMPIWDFEAMLFKQGDGAE